MVGRAPFAINSFRKDNDRDCTARISTAGGTRDYAFTPIMRVRCVIPATKD